MAEDESLPDIIIDGAETLPRDVVFKYRRIKDAWGPSLERCACMSLRSVLGRCSPPMTDNKAEARSSGQAILRCLLSAASLEKIRTRRKLHKHKYGMDTTYSTP